MHGRGWSLVDRRRSMGVIGAWWAAGGKEGAGEGGGESGRGGLLQWHCMAL